MDASTAFMLAEFATPVLIALCLSISFIFNRRIALAPIVFLALLQVTILSFRPDDYNSDTWNYSKYIQLLSNTEGAELLFVTKFEPLHLVLAWITQDFRAWLIFEGLICASLIVLLSVRLRRFESVVVILGSALPLFSSSLRFSMALLAISCLFTWYRRGSWNFVAATVIGLSTHVATSVAGILQRRHAWPVVLLISGFSIYAFADVALLERAGAGDDVVAGGAGLRPLITLAILLLLGYSRSVGYSAASLRKDLAIALFIFAITFLFFPVLNRWIILLLVIKAIELDRLAPLARRIRPGESLAALTLYLLLVIPTLISVSQKIGADDW